MTSIKDLIDTETDQLKLVVWLTGKEIQLMRNVLSDVEHDSIGVSLNLKISNAILDALNELDNVN